MLKGRIGERTVDALRDTGFGRVVVRGVQPYIGN